MQGNRWLALTKILDFIWNMYIWTFSNQGDPHPWGEQLRLDDQGVGAWHSWRPGGADPFQFEVHYPDFSLGCAWGGGSWFWKCFNLVKDPNQVPGLAVPGGTWFTRLVQTGDKNSAFSLFRCLAWARHATYHLKTSPVVRWLLDLTKETSKPKNWGSYSQETGNKWIDRWRQLAI